jgi:hypothetical protein
MPSHGHPGLPWIVKWNLPLSYQQYRSIYKWYLVIMEHLVLYTVVLWKYTFYCIYVFFCLYWQGERKHLSDQFLLFIMRWNNIWFARILFETIIKNCDCILLKCSMQKTHPLCKIISRWVWKRRLIKKWWTISNYSKKRFYMGKRGGFMR